MHKMINIHTHHPSYGPDILEVEIVDARQIRTDYSTPFCLGIHPWYIEEVDFLNFKEQITKLKSHPLFWGMGEIGLDKFRNKDLTKQTEIFEAQLLLAKELGINNVQIHCVKAFNECFSSLKSVGFKGNIIMHAFHSTPQLLKQFQREFNTYVSMGESILKMEKTQVLLEKINTDYLFLETDDNKDSKIENCYQLCAQKMNINVDQLITLISSNYNRLTNN